MDRPTDGEAHFKRAPRKTVEAAFHFLYGQDAGFSRSLCRAQLRVSSEGLLLVPQKHSRAGSPWWAKGQLQRPLLAIHEAGPDIEIAKTSVLAIEEVKRRFHSLPWCPFE